MNGAQRLIRTLVECGVDVCFMNPGTSEMHFVAALDEVPEMRASSGCSREWPPAPPTATAGWPAAGGHPAAPRAGARQRPGQPAQRPAGPDPVVNIVGDHATYHLRYDPPSGLGHREPGPAGVVVVPLLERPAVGRDTVDAVAAAYGPPGSVATLMVPADVSWTEGGRGRRPEGAGRMTPRGPYRSRRRPMRGRGGQGVAIGPTGRVLLGGGKPPGGPG
jgi:acetolactate synthase-1/2/3 large subunit